MTNIFDKFHLFFYEHPDVQNPHLKKLTVDYLYHFDIDSASTNLKEKFGDVKYVVMGGPDERMTSFAMSLYRRLRGKNSL